MSHRRVHEPYPACGFGVIALALFGSATRKQLFVFCSLLQAEVDRLAARTSGS